MQSTVKICSQKTFETLKISLSEFNFLRWYELQYINYVESPVMVACQWLRMLTWFQLFSISLFSLGAVFYVLRLRSYMDLITFESELHGSVSRMQCPMLSHIGSDTQTWKHLEHVGYLFALQDRSNNCYNMFESTSGTQKQLQWFLPFGNHF